MLRIIALTFVFLGWSFYTLSGGADYQPREGSRQAEALKLKAQPQLRLAETADCAPAAKTATVSLPDIVTRNATGLTEFAAPASPQKQRVTDSVEPSASEDRIELASANMRVASLTLSEPAAFAQAAGFAPTTEDAKPVSQESLRDLRRIIGTSVNMRTGPGTRYGVLTRVTRNTEVEVLEIFDNGWMRLRVLDTQRIGWVSGTLVSADQG